MLVALYVITDLWSTIPVAATHARAVVGSTVRGQDLMCNGSNLVGFNDGDNITTTYCQQGSNDVKLFPPMEAVYRTIGIDKPVLFVTCRAQADATVFVRAECICGNETVFKSQSRRCKNSSTASPGLNIVYVRPADDVFNHQVTTYIEEFDLNSNRTILIQCIVRNDSDNKITGIFNATIIYETPGDNNIPRIFNAPMCEPPISTMTEPPMQSSARGLLMREELFIIVIVSLLFLGK